jgi:hypothetical protein
MIPRPLPSAPDEVVRRALDALTEQEREKVAATVARIVGIGGPVFSTPTALQALWLLCIADEITPPRARSGGVQ